MMRARHPLDYYLKEDKVIKSWALNKKRLVKLLKDTVVKAFNHDPLVEVHDLSAGEFRIRVNSAVGSRYFRVKVVQEK
jgi:hypothetical protein